MTALDADQSTKAVAETSKPRPTRRALRHILSLQGTGLIGLIRIQFQSANCVGLTLQLLPGKLWN